MKKLALLALPLLFASIAQARPSTWEMTCAQTADLVRSSRGIVMNYEYSDRAGYLYKLYFPFAAMCRREGPYQGKKAYVKTTDSNLCFIGYECVPRDNDRSDRGAREDHGGRIHGGRFQ